MIILYNILLSLFIILAAPLLIILAVFSPKYRGRVPHRLGFGLEKKISTRLKKQQQTSQTIWVHALSVGEVFSSQPLIKNLRTEFLDSTIVFSTATKTGEEQAKKHLRNHIDLFIPFPYDFYFSAVHFIKTIKPDLFILVETDFWPNFLHILNRNKIPCLLVNGRVSMSSFNRYKKLSFIFRPLFSSFCYISMQTKGDAEKLKQIGVSANKIKSLGNLKYDAALPAYSRQMRLYSSETINRRNFGIPARKTIWVAGSTHAGEEGTIFSIYKRLSLLFPELLLVIAPRQPDRSREIRELAASMGLTCRFRSSLMESRDETIASVLILDTMGELPQLYGSCNMAFIGGSLVPEGGHNPLEPAAFGKPVIFGPYMDDFTEISSDLLDNDAARTCNTEDELFETLHGWLQNKVSRLEAGEKAKRLVEQNQGVTERHISIIRECLADEHARTDI